MTTKIAFNVQDRFVVTLGNQIVVTTQNGDVFGHDVSGHRSGEAFKFSGSKAAFNQQDRFVVTLGNKLIVITQNGDVFGHDVSGRDIGQPFRFSGSKAAFNHDQDRFVVTIGNKLIVTTQNGDVFGHDVSGRDIGQPFKFTGSKMAFNPQDRFVVTLGDTMIVTTKNGDAFGADVSGRDIGPIFQLNPLDALRLRLVDRIFEIEAIGDGFELNSGVNVHHQFQTLGFDGVSHHAFGDTDTTTDGDGHFDGMTFSIPSNTFNIEASAVDVATGRTTIATVLRPQVR